MINKSIYRVCKRSGQHSNKYRHLLWTYYDKFNEACDYQCVFEASLTGPRVIRKPDPDWSSR